MTRSFPHRTIPWSVERISLSRHVLLTICVRSPFSISTRTSALNWNTPRPGSDLPAPEPGNKDPVFAFRKDLLSGRVTGLDERVAHSHER